VPDPFSPPRLPDLRRVLARFWLPLIAALLLVGTAAFWVVAAFDDRGYAPVQPIAFSHKLHAGDLKLDCRYCHSGADKGRHATIPASQVCMGCHSQVATDKPEIDKLAKLHAAGGVQWAKVHDLADYAYFSHEWHVQAGVACQTCHGPVEDMTVMRQFAPLTMQWCLDCHRQNQYTGAAATPARAREPGAGHAIGAPDNASAIAHQRRLPPVDFSLPRDEHGKIDVKKMPESHRKAYEQINAEIEAARRAQPPVDVRMNAATQCSTCHQ
jgi:cytochrome c553